MSDIIQLSVGIESAATPRTSFGIPLILDGENFKSSQANAPVIKTYGSLSEMTDDGWKSYHAAYRLAAGLFAQQPRPAIVKVAGAATGTEANDLDDILEADPDWYVLLYTSRVAADIKAAAAWVETAGSRCIYIAETNDAAAKAPGATVLTQLHALNYKRTACMYRDSVVQVQRIVLDAVFVNLNQFNATIQGLVFTHVFADTHAATMLALATALQNLGSIATAVSSASGALGAGVHDTITVTSVLPLSDVLVASPNITLGASQASVAVYEDTASCTPLDAAWVGKVLPKAAGSATWAHKTLDGGVLVDVLTAGQRTIIKAQNANFYVNELGFDITYPGSMVGDSAPGTPMWIDLIQGMDALESDLQTALMDILNKAEKIPYTDQGVAAILSAATATEQKFVGSGFLVQKDFDDTYTVPLVADAIPADKSNRILRGLQANYQTAGGIHAIADFTVKLAA